MLTHSELLNNMQQVRGVIIKRYSWFIHVTTVKNLSEIRTGQLEPRADAQPKEEVILALGPTGRNILCLHPLGAARVPSGTKYPPLVTLAINSEHLPQKIGLDWSYSWEIVEGRFELYAELSIERFVSRIAHEFGSIVSYEPIQAKNLRIHTKCAPPTNPSHWPYLLETADELVCRHT